jgi:glycosyltransferase involved in cell wall biosynthesis
MPSATKPSPNTLERAADGDLPLSIAFLAYRGKPHVGGQGVYTRHLTKALVDLGHRVEVLGGQPFPELDERVPLVELPSLDIYNDYFPMRMPGLWELKSFGDWLEVTTFSTGTFPEPLAFSVRALQHLRPRVGEFDLVQDNQCLGYGLLGIERLGLPVLATIHHPITVDRRLEMEHAETAWQRFSKGRWYAFTKMQTRVASRMTRVLTVSQNSNKDIHADHKVPLERMNVVPVGVDQNLFRPMPDVERVKGRLITTASADVTMKGLRYLLEAVAKLRTERHVELVVIGRLKEGGPSARTIDELGLRDAVTFITGVPEQRIIELYSEAELAVVPSLYEGFSLPAIEAMSCGVPLVATTGGALPEVVGTDGDTALLVEPGDSDALAARIRTALDEPELRARVGAAGRQRVIDRWTWRHTAVGTVEQYRALLHETAAIQARRPGGAGNAPRYRRRPSRPAADPSPGA